MQPASSPLPLSAKIFLICGAWLIGLGAYFIFVRPAFLPEDPRYIGSSIESIRAVAPGLERWLGHVFRVLGGFMMATGAATILNAWHLLKRRERGTLPLMAMSGATGVALMSGTNFLLQSDFKWPLLRPALLWLVGLVCYAREKARHAGTAANADSA